MAQQTLVTAKLTPKALRIARQLSKLRAQHLYRVVEDVLAEALGREQPKRNSRGKSK